MPRVKVPVPAESAKPAETVVETPPEAPATESNPVAAATPAASRFSNPQFLVKLFAVAFVVLLIAVIALISSRNHLETQVNKLSNPATTSRDEAKQLANQIGQTFLLPTGETPTLATVTDITKVQGQAFFKNARNGDKVLLYSHAGEAILYRPSVKKVINVAQVNLNNSTSGTSSTSSPATTQ